MCAIGTGPEDIRAEARFDTDTPDVTLAQVQAFFQAQQHLGPLNGVGIASFGPIDPDPGSPRFGYVTTTPKPGWAQTDFAGRVHRMLGVPVGFDTDVNVAALGTPWGAALGLDTFIYLTVGTGIGGGGMVNGKLIHGMMHPEMGHIRVPHDAPRTRMKATAPTMVTVWRACAADPQSRSGGCSGRDLAADHPAWALEARYLAYGLLTCSCR